MVILNEIFPGISYKVKEFLNCEVRRFPNDTYVACLSEHSNKENAHGRLSMWRSYSELTGVALVFNNTPFLANSAPPGIYSSPVAYFDDADYEHQLERIICRVIGNEQFLRGQREEAVICAVFEMIKFAALCTKHPGFEEEQEWRAIYLPAEDNSFYLERAVKVFKGVPQPIHKFPFKNIPNINFMGVEIPELLDRIIIGPTKYPDAMRETFATLLAEVGVPDPASRIYVSDIPLRT